MNDPRVREPYVWVEVSGCQRSWMPLRAAYICLLGVRAVCVRVLGTM